MNAQVDNKSKTEERAASGLCAAEGTGARTDARTMEQARKSGSASARPRSYPGSRALFRLLLKEASFHKWGQNS